MDDQGNERTLFYSAVTDLTGEEEHERVAELEVIFGPYEEIDAHALRRCANLQRITLINCRLRRIPTLALGAVRESLVHLCLSSQSISKLEPLELPNLRALYLQHNQIERIEGLESCRRLQKLWMCSNRIRRVENLGQCTDLRELWLQDNVIQSISASENDRGLGQLVNLEALSLAKNRIRDINDLQAIGKVVNLRTLVMADEHFGSNPIVRHPEYRLIAISSLRLLQNLDGTAVADTERASAVDRFLQQAIAFNDVVAELALGYEQELRAIQTRKEMGESNADMMKRELAEALNEVEQAVVRGKVELNEEKERQMRLRDRHMQSTASTLQEIHQRNCQDLDRMLEDEFKKLDEEELRYEVLEQEAEAEQSLSLTLATLQCTLPQRIAVEHLTEHAADFQHIAAHIGSTDESNNDEKYRLLQIHRFYHADLVLRFDKSATFDQENKRSVEGSLVHLYCTVSEDEVMDLLHHGFDPSHAGAASKWLALFSSPLQALELSDGFPGPFTDDKANGTSSAASSTAAARIRSHILLMCQVMMVNVSEVAIGEVSMNQLRTLPSIVSLATAAASNPATYKQHEFIHMRFRNSEPGGDIYIVNREGGLPNVLPQFIVLCSQRLVRVKKTCNVTRDEANIQPEALLSSFARDVENEIVNYGDRLWKEIDPEVWCQKIQLQQDRARFDKELAQTKEQVIDEKRAQRKLLRSARLRK